MRGKNFPSQRIRRQHGADKVSKLLYSKEQGCGNCAGNSKITQKEGRGEEGTEKSTNPVLFAKFVVCVCHVLSFLSEFRTLWRSHVLRSFD